MVFFTQPAYRRGLLLREFDRVYAVDVQMIVFDFEIIRDGPIGL